MRRLAQSVLAGNGQYPVVSCIEMCVKVRGDDPKQWSVLWYAIVLKRFGLAAGQSS